MNRKVRNSAIVAGAIAAVGVAALVLIMVLWGRFFYPKPDQMPPAVTQSMDDLLQQFETTLVAKTSGVGHQLQPGLTDDQIATQEVRGGISLGDELRTLYRWKNGIAGGSDPGIMEGHSFPPLEGIVDEVLEQRRQFAGLSGGQKLAWNMFAGHRTNWIPVFTDGAGDGYFYDPNRTPGEGAYFYHMAETADYTFFPSLRNIIRGMIEGYESGAIRQTLPGKLEVDYTRMQEIWSRNGKPHAQTE